ncbi:MAG TPA: hypothetical protein V6C90_01930 [Coleofasciculaceae cyanobacterium]|jgi:hypothetical protein
MGYTHRAPPFNEQLIFKQAALQATEDISLVQWESIATPVQFPHSYEELPQ